jgi:hypothetical protein
MYFRAGQYPELQQMSRPQRLKFVASSIRNHGHSTGWRLLTAFVIIVASSGSVGFLPESLGIPDWGGTAVAVGGGALFYVYMLWELNGPLLVAVRAQAKDLLHASNDA